MNEYTLIHGDCLEVLPLIEDKSVDMILCDLPYGVTQNKADRKINLQSLWIQYKRVIKQKGNMVFTSQFPYTLELIQSNYKWFRYDLVWDKILVGGFLNANRRQLRRHEQVLIFYASLGTYNPQKTLGKQSHSRGEEKELARRNYGEHGFTDINHSGMKFPTSILSFSKPHSSKARHPTEKPVKLFEYLIKTYSNTNEVVLDNCLGSGTTMEACQNLERSCIGIEISEEYCDMTRERCFNRNFLDRQVKYDYRTSCQKVNKSV